MKKLITSALLGASLSLAACGGNDQAAEDTGAMAEGDAMSADPTLTGPGDTTSAAGAGADTGAMDAAGGAMDPGAAGDPGAMAEDDAAGGAAAGGADAGAGAGAAGDAGAGM